MMPKHVVKENEFHVLCYAACIFLFSIGHTKIQNLNMVTRAMVTYGKCVPVLLSSIVLLRNTKANGKTVAAVLIFASLLLYSFVQNDLSYVMFFILFFMVACRQSNETLMYKMYTCVVLFVLIITILCALMGILVNDNSWQGRYDLGFNYCTFGPNLFLSASLALVAWRKENISWKEWLFILGLNQYLYWKAETDAVYICVLVIFVFWLLIRLKRIYRMINNSRIIGWLISHIYIILAIVTILFQLYYNFHYTDSAMIAINKLLSNRPIMGRNVFLRYGPGVGQIIKELLLGMGIEKATYLDSSFLALLTAYGIPLLLAFCFFMDIICRKAYIIGDLYLVICLVVFALHCITDPQLSSFRANPFIITSLINLKMRKEVLRPISNRKNSCNNSIEGIVI